jgi:hypothetical protein
MARPEQAISHEEVLHRYKHRMRLLLRHNRPARLHLLKHHTRYFGKDGTNSEYWTVG